MYFKVSVLILSAIFFGIGRYEENTNSIGQKDSIGASVFRAVRLLVCDTRNPPQCSIISHWWQ